LRNSAIEKLYNRDEARAMGCVLIGPVVGLSLGTLDNSFEPNSFKKKNPLRWAFGLRVRQR
jgi:hypothetical protein